MAGVVRSWVLGAQLEEALTAVTETDGYVEAPETNSALAAAALVAMFVDTALPAPASIDQSWLESVRAAPPDRRTLRYPECMLS